MKKCLPLKTALYTPRDSIIFNTGIIKKGVMIHPLFDYHENGRLLLTDKYFYINRLVTITGPCPKNIDTGFNTINYYFVIANISP